MRPAILAGVLLIVPSLAQAPVAVPAQGRLTDAQAAELARESLGSQDPTSMRQVLIRLRSHPFHSSKVPEREVVLFAEGTLEARLGNLAGAVIPLRKLEQQWPDSPYTAEAQVILAEDAVARKRFPEAERRLHLALAADIPAERKRRAQELMLWTLVQQGRPLEGLPIVEGLLPLESGLKPSEQGLAAMEEVLCAGGKREQAEGVRRSFENLYPASHLLPRVELDYARMLGKAGDASGAAEALRRIIKDFPLAEQSDEARLALADLLTSGKLPAGKDLPTPQSLLDAIRKGGGLPKGKVQLVELRVLVSKSRWGDALDLVDGLDPEVRLGDGEFQTLWLTAWRHWADQCIEKGLVGELLPRLKPGAFRSLDAKERLGVASLLASQGLLATLPPLLQEAPPSERAKLRQIALSKADPQAQPEAVLSLLPGKVGAADEAMMKARALATLGRWSLLRPLLAGLHPGAERIRVLTNFLRRPLEAGERASQRLKEAESWLARAPERGAAREPLAILVADLRFQEGDAKGALALYPVQAADPAQRGWVALMRAKSMLKLGQRDAARDLIRSARYEQGFRGERDALAAELKAY